MNMLLLLIVIILLFGGGGMWYGGHRAGMHMGYTGGGIGFVLVVVLVIFLLVGR